MPSDRITGSKILVIVRQRRRRRRDPLSALFALPKSSIKFLDYGGKGWGHPESDLSAPDSVIATLISAAREIKAGEVGLSWVSRPPRPPAPSATSTATTATTATIVVKPSDS
jgi:hypothetical protein